MNSVGQKKVTVEAEETEQSKSMLDLVESGVYKKYSTNDLTHMQEAKNIAMSCVFMPCQCVCVCLCVSQLINPP